jgi:hypothetical protein
MFAWKQQSIQRVRNSSLVERSRAENKRASNRAPKLWTRKSGRGAFRRVEAVSRGAVERAEKQM